MPRVEDRQLQCIDDTAHCVDDTAGQKPAKCSPRKGIDDLCKCQDAYPAHGDVEYRGEPFGTIDPAGLDDHFLIVRLLRHILVTSVSVCPDRLIFCPVRFLHFP